MTAQHMLNKTHNINDFLFFDRLIKILSYSSKTGHVRDVPQCQSHSIVPKIIIPSINQK